MWLLVVIIIILFYIYKYGTKNFKYWEQRGVNHDTPLPIVGNNTRQFFQRISRTDIYVEMYKKYPEERFVGYYAGSKIQLILRDPELIKHVLVTDFNYFYSRGLTLHKTIIEPLLKNLFFVDGDLWKMLRQRLTPTFSTGKLKSMFPLIIDRAERLKKTAAIAAASGTEVDVKDIIARFAMEVIGACGFGIDIDTLNDETSNFFRLGKRTFERNTRDTCVGIMKYLAPEPCKHLRFMAPEVEKTATALVKTVMEQRNYKYSGRNDFVDILLEIKEKGKIVGESIERTKADGTPATAELELTELLMVAQVFLFFAAGFETSSSVTSFTFHQLAFHPEVQRKCQQEIDKVLSRYDNKLCYEAVREMPYLEMVIKESMRMFPPLGFLIRKCVKKYTFPDTNLSIDEGVYVVIPTQALHCDEKYFEEPDKFKPERFHPDNVNNIPKHAYLPFGEGPRICIGERLGVMQSLTALTAILSQFTVSPSKNSLREPIRDCTTVLTQNIKNGLPLILSPRKKTQ